MPAKYSYQEVTPNLLLREIQDVYIRQNFSNLFDYFSNQNQLVDFKFFDLSFDKEEDNFKMDHGLGVVPQDLIVTKISGTGTVKFNRGKFTKEQLDISVTGPAKIRFFVGSYWKEKFSTSEQDEDEVSEYRSTESENSFKMPSGSIVAFGGETAPDGWLVCDGSALKKEEYEDLFEAIGSAYGVTTTTFNIPDLRGRFLRGWDNGAGVDPDANARTASSDGGNTGDKIGSVQEDAFETHTHTAPYNRNGTSGFPNAGYASGDSSSATGTVRANNPTGGNETRPKNINVNYIIKA